MSDSDLDVTVPADAPAEWRPFLLDVARIALDGLGIELRIVLDDERVAEVHGREGARLVVAWFTDPSDGAEGFVAMPIIDAVIYDAHQGIAARVAEDLVTTAERAITQRPTSV